MLSLSKFYSKALVPHGEFLLVDPSASPEQQATAEQIERLTGSPAKGKHFATAGCTFDQGFVWETFSDTLALAEKLGKTDPFLETIREEMGRLDPIQVGADGQIKEYREETHYSDIGDPKHRHISHICPLFPGTLINPTRPEWMRAASKTLDLRGIKTTGWALAHRMNSRARLGEGDKAHEVYQELLRERTLPIRNSFANAPCRTSGRCILRSKLTPTSARWPASRRCCCRAMRGRSNSSRPCPRHGTPVPFRDS
ncbi:hypothetical protein EBU02_10155 [bacterium]|nr:hypothetical protein [bacterium]